jgi:hypothetical protein
MEALGVAANVTAVVGIAGQVLRGCAYLSTISDDARDAPQDLQSLRLELRIIEQIVASTPSQQRDALVLCQQAVDALRADVDKYCDVGNAGSSRRWLSERRRSGNILRR